MSSQQLSLRCKHSGFTAISSRTVYILSVALLSLPSTQCNPCPFCCILRKNHNAGVPRPLAVLKFLLSANYRSLSFDLFVYNLCSVLQPRVSVQCRWESGLPLLQCRPVTMWTMCHLPVPSPGAIGALRSATWVPPHSTHTWPAESWALQHCAWHSWCFLTGYMKG